MNIKPFIITSTCLLTACGGGSDSDSGTTPTPVPTSPPINEGGTFSNPAALDLGIPNAIDAISSNNYFSFDSFADAMLIVHAELDSPLVMQDFTRCATESGAGSSIISETYYSGLIVEDTWQSCSIDLSYQFSDAAQQVLRIAYNYNTPGTFEAALFDPNAVMGSNLSTSSSGRPDEPILIREDEDNRLLANNFYNYFGVALSAGDQIRLDAYLNNTPTGQEPSRCQGQMPLEHYQGYGISIDYNAYNCDESLTFTATETKVYIFHFKYTENDSSGYFRASIRRN